MRLEDDRVVLLDQRRLPGEAVELECRSAAEVAEAIRDARRPRRARDRRRGGHGLRARRRARGGPRRRGGGAPRLAADRGQPRAGRSTRCGAPAPIRPCWPSGRARSTATRSRAACDGRARRSRSSRAGRRALYPLQHRGARDRPGTARRSARSARAFATGLLEHVFVDETRPLYQGARLTAWELERAGIPHTVIVDGAAGVAAWPPGEVTPRGRRRRPDRRERRRREQDRHL